MSGLSREVLSESISKCIFFTQTGLCTLYGLFFYSIRQFKVKVLDRPPEEQRHIRVIRNQLLM